MQEEEKLMGGGKHADVKNGVNDLIGYMTGLSQISIAVFLNPSWDSLCDSMIWGSRWGERLRGSITYDDE